MTTHGLYGVRHRAGMLKLVTWFGAVAPRGLYRVRRRAGVLKFITLSFSLSLSPSHSPSLSLLSLPAAFSEAYSILQDELLRSHVFFRNVEIQGLDSATFLKKFRPLAKFWNFLKYVWSVYTYIYIYIYII